MSIVLPPDEIKTIVDKTAKFVAKLGLDFQQRIYDNERNNPKFSFLETADPFHPFYQSRVEYFRQELASSGTLVTTQAASSWSGAEPPAAPPPSPPREGAGGETVAVSEPPKHGQNSLAWKVFQMEKKMKGMTIEPPAPFHFIGEIPEDITPLDLDIMKLTAQFVARNGHQFQTGLMNREHKNPQFEFLKPNSESNPYFQQLVESYSKCIVASKDTVNKMKIEYNRQLLLDKLVLRYQYNKEQEKLQREKEKLEKEETMSANIDWHDFVIVETIDFREEEQQASASGGNNIGATNVPMPMPSSNNSDEMEMEMEVEMEVEQPSMDITMSKPSSEMRIRRDYVKPTTRVVDASKKTTKCPKCGMDIPVDDIEEHMRIELLDPRYAQQRQIQLERSRATTSANDNDIAKNLGAFAKRRTDIFEDELDYAPVAPSVNAIPSKSIQDQIQAIHERKGLVPPPPSSSAKPTPPPPGINPPLPPAKKLKTGEEDNLIPEKEFLEKHKDSPQITLTIQCPAEEKSEWNLKGQSIKVTVNLTDNVATLKEKIKDAIGMPPNKMKLKGGELHLKDDSMAYYNFTSGTVLQLSKRERGGKR